MSDFGAAIFYIAGFVASVFVFIALMQLFAIRRVLGTLVRLQFPNQADAALRRVIITNYVPAQDAPEQRAHRDTLGKPGRNPVFSRPGAGHQDLRARLRAQAFGTGPGI